MNDKFQKRLCAYLDSECSDYDLEYSWEWDEDCNWCDVKIFQDRGTRESKEIHFRYNQQSDDLSIELSEDSFYVTREFDQTVKYFWMLISPTLFPDA